MRFYPVTRAFWAQEKPYARCSDDSTAGKMDLEFLSTTASDFIIFDFTNHSFH